MSSLLKMLLQQCLVWLLRKTSTVSINGPGAAKSYVGNSSDHHQHA